MENDLCQNHPPHNYNMLITYFIKEVYYGLADEIMQAKDTWRKGSDACIPPSLALPSSAPPVIPSLFFFRLKYC